MQLKIGTKISLGFLCMLALIIILGGSSFFSLKSSKERLAGVDGANTRLVLELKIQNSFLSGVAAIRGFIAYGDEKFYDQVELYMDSALTLENELMAIARSDKKQDVQSLISVTEQYRNGLLKDLSPVVREYHKERAAGNAAKAGALFVQMNGIARNLVPMTDQIAKTLSFLVADNEAILKAELENANNNASGVMKVSVITTAAAVLIGALLSILLTRKIRNPILRIVSGAQKLSSGDFTKSIQIKTNDEIGDLADALEKMKGNFKDVLMGIQNSSRRLNEASQQLAAQAQQTSAGASETAATMGEIASTVDNMSQNTQEVAHRANIASKHADKGYQGIELVNSQMSEITSSSLQVSNSIEALNTAIARIGQFVEVITNIANQTNLLALNAAIEAARAGEAGRGFAVVAEEVRKLAEQSALSTKEIEQLINQIGDQSGQAIQAMNAGSVKVTEGNRIVTEVGQSFGEIINAVQDLTNQVQNVAAAAQEVSAGVQNVAGTTEEQTAAMEEVSAATENLNNLANELNTLTLKFKF